MWAQSPRHNQNTVTLYQSDRFTVPGSKAWRTHAKNFFFTFSPTLVSAPTPWKAHRPPGTNSSSTCLPTACLSFIRRPSLSPFFQLPLSLSCTFYWMWHVNFLQISAIYLLKLLERWPTYKLYLNWMLDLVLFLGLFLLLSSSLFILLLLSSFCLFTVALIVSLKHLF